MLRHNFPEEIVFATKSSLRFFNTGTTSLIVGLSLGESFEQRKSTHSKESKHSCTLYFVDSSLSISLKRLWSIIHSLQLEMSYSPTCVSFGFQRTCRNCKHVLCKKLSHPIHTLDKRKPSSKLPLVPTNLFMINTHESNLNKKFHTYGNVAYRSFQIKC